MKKNEEIELLRAVAIIFTLFQHLGSLLMPSKEAWIFVNINNPYWGGVDLFFCISGYVISKSMVSSWHSLPTKTKWLEIKSFWLRRFFRIVPTLWLWVGISLLACLYFNESGAFGTIRPDLNDSLAAVLNYSNLHVFLCVIGSSSCGPNPVYWSLSLEEQFYLALPILFFFPRKTLILLLGTAILIQLPIHRMPWEQTVGGALWFIRTDSILLGVMIAYFSRTPLYNKIFEIIKDRNRYPAIGSFILIIGLSAIPRSGFYFAAGGITIISALLVLLASFDRGLLFPMSILSKPFLWIGSRSFSIYLIHMPAYYLVNEIAYRASGYDITFKIPLTHNSFNPALALSTFIALAILAECNYRFIETPLRKLGRRVADRKEPVITHKAISMENI